MLRAVLDANIYVSAATRAQGPPGRILERYLRDSAFTLVLSAAIIDETRRALAYPKVRKYVRADIDAETWFDAIVVLADLVPGEAALDAVSDDPHDDKYLVAAIEGRANFVVSGDPDLLAIERFEDVYIISPRRFLDQLSADANGP